ncbi:hypothetical protein DFP72DRAFT_813581 [Ephemerocybe angulata]|uniref:Uncharacterized protein n=1 Tax=Ephemerocybe angulata TaxID=980116 RepID=A0A8H6HW78_9AGAR|nr:hypothetical protein DFP72DRAFT_813581 [Tulosesus angulatus]
MTSKAGYRAYKSSAIDRIRKCLKAFNLPVRNTLEMMQRGDVIVSGSAVLDILCPGLFTPGDLDIYVPRGKLSNVLVFLDSHTQYSAVSLASTASAHKGWKYDTSRDNGLNEVYLCTNDSTGKVLNVIETSSNTATAPIFLFHSTFVMNYFTWDAIVCAYPSMTSKKCGLANSWRATESAKIQGCREKYETRGFHILRNAREWDPRHRCHVDPCCGYTQRAVDDQATMWVCLSQDIFEAPYVGDSAVTWRLAGTYAYCDSGVLDPCRGWVVGSDGIFIGQLSHF